MTLTTVDKKKSTKRKIPTSQLLDALMSSKKKVYKGLTFSQVYNKYNKKLHGALGQLPPRTHPIQGRDQSISRLYKLIERPDTPVAMILGQAGVGKTALVEELVRQLNEDEISTELNNTYLLVNLKIPQLSSLGNNKMQAVISKLLDSIHTLELLAQKALDDKTIRFLLFIDEVHELVTVFGKGTKIGGDLMKESLARSPIRVIVATTHREYDSTILVDQPLSERFKNIELSKLDDKIVFDVAKSWWRSRFSNLPEPDDDLIWELIKANEAYRSDSAEPRKTLDIMEDFVSHSLRTGEKADHEVLSNIFKERYSIRLDFSVDPMKIFENLADNIIGQPFALYTWKRLLIKMMTIRKKNFNRPILTVLLSGPTGVGKTQSIKEVAKQIHGDKVEMKTFNMTGYKTENSVDAFLQDFGKYIKHHPDAVVLLDEFGKSHEDIKDMMLPILDEGIIEYDAINREGMRERIEASLRNSIIAATTNEGAEVFEKRQKYDAASSTRKDNEEFNPYDDLTVQQKSESNNLLTTLRSHLIDSKEFKPEMLNRFDKIIPYRGLSRGAFITIAQDEINRAIQEIEEDHDVKIITNEPQDWDPERYDYHCTDLALYIAAIKGKDDSTDSGGARSIIKAVEDSVQEELADAIIIKQRTGHTRFKLEVTKDSEIYIQGGDKHKGGIITYPIDENDQAINEDSTEKGVTYEELSS